jgi:hypothetical protein
VVGVGRGCRAQDDVDARLVDVEIGRQAVAGERVEAGERVGGGERDVVERRAGGVAAHRAVEAHDGEREPVAVQQLAGAAGAPRRRGEHRDPRVRERADGGAGARADPERAVPERAVEVGDDEGRRGGTLSHPSSSRRRYVP